MRGWIVNETREAIIDFLHKNQAAAGLLDSIVHNEKLRKELNAVKKEAKEAARRIEIKIPKLKDCKFHLRDKKRGEESTIFITEGVSAAGSIVSSAIPKHRQFLPERQTARTLFNEPSRYTKRRAVQYDDGARHRRRKTCAITRSS